MTEARSYVPAAGVDWLLPFYDPLLRLVRFDRTRHELIAAADVQPGQRVLDLGCGTGELALAIHAHCPEAAVVGLDPDPKALARARNKAERAGAAIEWRQGFADALPFDDASFDCVVSSLVFHHLPPDVVRAALPEIRRVLAPGGSLWVLDLVHGGTEGLHGWLARFASHQHGEEDVNAALPMLMQGAGFDETGDRPVRSIFGRLTLAHGRVPLG